MIYNTTHVVFNDAEDKMDLVLNEVKKDEISFSIKVGKLKDVTLSLHRNVWGQLKDYVEESFQDFDYGVCERCGGEATICVDTQGDESYNIKRCDNSECGFEEEV